MTATFDVTARKAHQWTMVALVIVAFLFQEAAGILLLAAGAVMVAGRFWWPADLVRQLVWRVLEPRGILKRRERVEDHETRRVARLIGGLIWLATGAAIVLDAPAGALVGAWAVTLAIALMVVLDASVDFCALCFLARLTQRRA